MASAGHLLGSPTRKVSKLLCKHKEPISSSHSHPLVAPILGNVNLHRLVGQTAKRQITQQLIDLRAIGPAESVGLIVTIGPGIRDLSHTGSFEAIPLCRAYPALRNDRGHLSQVVRIE